MSNEIEVLKEHYIAHVLRGDFTATLALIKVRASQLDATSNCMVLLFTVKYQIIPNYYHYP